MGKPALARAAWDEVLKKTDDIILWAEAKRLLDGGQDEVLSAIQLQPHQQQLIQQQLAATSVTAATPIAPRTSGAALRSILLQ